MKRLIFLGLVSLTTLNFLFADEYFEEVTTHLDSEVVYESIDSLPITQTVEQQERERNENNKIVKEKLPDVNSSEEEVDISTSTSMETTKQSIQATTYINALEQAKSEGKIILLTIRSTDCKYCDEMEAGTLSDASVKDAIVADFIKINYNQDLDVLPLGLQHGMTPNFIFLNSNEDIINMYPGMRTPEEFKEVLKQILAE
ncbi:MAG: Unknown protein [uncultured Sulfurovum sp.]|uniref:Thioredoxin-like fold domain-containing protein n=1 Tax=uncultured Sulfurovum sp. TaxID=269237 RepID=A0A6S6T2L6_9BACT|nr:MAG: Unknown protein [uncultured Sulfurovum sp.]